MVFHYISTSVRFPSDLVNANVHLGSTADDIFFMKMKTKGFMSPCALDTIT